jgi:hypothetical protein
LAIHCGCCLREISQPKQWLEVENYASKEQKLTSTSSEKKNMGFFTAFLAKDNPHNTSMQVWEHSMDIKPFLDAPFC